MNVTEPNPPNLPAGPARNNGKWIKWALGITAVLFMGLIGLIPLAFYGLSLGAIPLLVGLVFAFLPLPIYLALALWVDRYEKEPLWMLAIAFLWGATVSFFFAVLNVILTGSVVGSLVGPGAAQFVTTVVTAPIVEETTKGLALFILFFWKKDEFDNVIDGIVYAAMVGLGFAVVENYGYYGSYFGEAGIVGSGFVFVVRGILSPFMHPVFTSMTGIGLGISRQSRNTFVQFAAPVVGLLAAMALHALWNGSSYIHGPLVGAMNLSSFAELLVSLAIIAFQSALLMIPLLIFIFFALRREGRTVRHFLTPELQSGLITQQEYNTLGSVFGRIGSSFRALSSGGFGGWRSHSRFAQTATELAFHRDRVSRGITSVDAASREAAYVQSLRQFKGV